MTSVFADSFYFFALINPRDEAHIEASNIATKVPKPIVTSSWVLLELADGMATTSSRSLCASFMRQLSKSRNFNIVSASMGHFEKGLDLYVGRPDKAWSLTDCISMIIMQDRGITSVLTGDHHFAQAGFQVLLPGKP